METVSLWFEGEVCWHNGSHLLVQKKKKKKKVVLYLFSFITFLRQFNNWEGTWQQWRHAPCKAIGGNSALLWMYEHHSTTHARYVLSVFYSATTDCCSLFNTTPLVLIWPSCIFLLFLGGWGSNSWHIVTAFVFIFLHLVCWLTRGDSEWHLQDEHAHTIWADTADKSTSLPFLSFAIEYISTVSHCHSLWQ